MKNENSTTKQCKYCKSEIDKKAKVCPVCKKKQGGLLKWVIIAIVAIALISTFTSNDSAEQPKNVTNEQPSPIETVTLPESESTEPESEYTTFKASTYKVGVDIPEGEYIIYADNAMGYLEVSKDSSGTIDSIITNSNISYNEIISVSNGQYLKMTSCYAVPISENPPVDASGEGTFKVGLHIPAGEYKVEVDSNNSVGYGYIQVSSDSKGYLSSIISNDNFEGSKYITVEDGQYLTLSGCHIVIE